MNPARLFVASTVVGLWAFSANAADLRPEDAASHIGETATVCGMVASAKFEAHARSQPTLLDLGKSYPHAILPRSYTEIIGPNSALPKLRFVASASV